MKTDNQLLESYARHGSENDFRELVERRINLVLAAALRESRGDAARAEDITQAVFTELARQADSLTRHPALAGWLYTCVRRMAANDRRAEDRRQRREQEAFTMNELLSTDSTDSFWQQLRPVLDDVMHELNEEDRTAVVLRFFEGRSLKEVGLALGLNENAARMRVERSLEKLRHFLSHRGVNSTLATLAGALALGAVSNASAALAANVAAGALTATVSESSASLLSATALKVVVAGLVMLAGTFFVVRHQIRASHADASRTSPPVAALQTSVTTPSRTETPAVIPLSASTNPASSPKMTLHVVEAESGAPLVNAKIHLYYFGGPAKVVKGVTDASGQLGVDALQPLFKGLNLFAAAGGHAPKTVTWSHAPVLPEEYTLKLPQGTTIGGIVEDEAGKPIADAKIDFSVPGGTDMSQNENIEFGPDTAVRTDSNGRWSCNMVPKDLDQVSLLITHSNHAEMDANIQPAAPDANNFVITMAAGFAVGGAVTDLNGLAIPRARVRQVRHNSEAEASVKTDALGNFALKNMKAGELTLSVQAGGFAAQVKTIQVPVKGPALQFQLGPGCLLRGHIVDENGRPIPQARVETATDSMSYRKVEWSTKTGAAGRFEWDSAPQESLLYTVSANGFRPADPLTLPADGSDHEIKLTHMRAGIDFVQITGTAVDADTSQPLDAFTVGIRRVEPTWVVPFEFGTSGKEGKFSLLAPGTAFHTNYQLQLKKDGYLPALSDILLAKDENQTLAFKLQKGSGPAGTVLLPGGEPAPNATVYLCTSQSGVTLQGPAHVPKGLNTTAFLAKTDESGRFTLAAATSPEGLIVIHEQGFAQLSLTSFTASSNITLQAWGRIEGRVVLDSKPVANESIFASHQDLRYDEQGRYFGFLTYTFETNTDSAGKFSFEKVPPGPCSVSRKNQGHTSHVMISSGAVTQVVLGGTGRPIVGNAVLPGATGAIDWSGARINLTSKTGTDPGPYPKRENFQSPAAFVQAMTNWGSAYDAQLHFSTVCENTGAFRLQDVPSGTYELEITLRETQRDSVSPTPRMGVAPAIAILVRAVIVPEIPGGHNDEPLDLGTLALVPQKESAAQQ